eukprot:1048141-Amphidinium_carterae.1
MHMLSAGAPDQLWLPPASEPLLLPPPEQQHFEDFAELSLGAVLAAGNFSPLKKIQLDVGTDNALFLRETCDQ